MVSKSLAITFWPWPFPRSRKSDIWQFLCLDLVEDLRLFPYFHIFCFGVALVKGKQHLESALARSCRYLPVSQNYQNIPDGLSAMAISAN